jgi:fatty acid desaturase
MSSNEAAPAPAASHPVYRPAPPDMPIRDGLNAVLVLGVGVTAVFLLWLGSHLEAWYAVLAVAVLFSYVGLTNYALLHEAAHGNLQSNRWRNYLGGVVAGCLFPMPLSMMRITHQGHHLRNRTDFEMFDLYYPTDSRLLKYGLWYGTLCGLFWPFVPLAALLFALCPWLFYLRLFHDYRPYRHLLGDVRKGALWKVRAELLLIAGVFAGLFWLLELRWQTVLLMYLSFGFNWSTRQYVGHAFSKRAVIDGAWNLRHNRLMSLVLLHGEYDLNHHRRPEVPWYYLPRLSAREDQRRDYLLQYWRQWLGPRPVTEPAPESLGELPLSVHQLDALRKA